jgi:lysophospholipase L1-like esterase
MEHILVYGDSLSWGIIPNTRQRLPFTQRWPGILETELIADGRKVRVTEDCLNGRRTAWEDPFKPGRNGLVGLGQRIEAHSPLALVIVMLGTNDFQFTHHNDAAHSAFGLGAIVRAIRSAPIEPGMTVPQILLVAPPRIQAPKGSVAAKFAGAPERCASAADAYRQIATEEKCGFFDANTVIAVSPLDGVHLEAPQHATLAKALLAPVTAALEKSGGTERRQR